MLVIILPLFYLSMCLSQLYHSPFFSSLPPFPPILFVILLLILFFVRAGNHEVCTEGDELRTRNLLSQQCIVVVYCSAFTWFCFGRWFV